jgi:hypothetical protein
MPVIRGHHSFDDHFTQIPNAWVRDERLSFKARGLLVLILSHTAGWSLSINTLAKQNQEGKDAIRAAINELEMLGYLSRTQQNENGRFGESVWTTNDPSDIPSSENPPSENPTTKKNITKEEQTKEYKKSTKISVPFHVTDELKDWFVDAKLPVDWMQQTDLFVDYYLGTGKTMKDWAAAWRNWMRKAAEYQKTPWDKAKDVAAVESKAKLETDKQYTQRLLEESRAAAESATPPPKCQHGESILRCKKCPNGLS